MEALGVDLPAGTEVKVYAPRTAILVVQEPVSIGDTRLQPGRPYAFADGRVSVAPDWEPPPAGR